MTAFGGHVSARCSLIGERGHDNRLLADWPSHHRSATFIIVLLVCLMRSPPASRAGVPISGPKDSSAVAALKQNAWIQQQELTAADGARDDVFGYSVDVSGQKAIIGAAGKTIGNNSGQGAAYVFTCSGTPCTWTQRQELTAADGGRGDVFGYSVAMSGNTAIIGAAYKNSYQGAAYIFSSSAVAIAGPPTPPP